MILSQISLRDITDSRSRGRDKDAEDLATQIIGDIRTRGMRGLSEWATKMGDCPRDAQLVITKDELASAAATLDKNQRSIIEKAARRISDFACAQRSSISDLVIDVPGGKAGHRWIPVSRSGCYVPGGRYPLPSSALMTVCCAKAAGVASVWCAGPKPTPISLAAAWIAGADGFVQAGGAQGIAALALGVGCPECDVVVGPGGRFAAAAKRILFGVVGTEAPAGPSELLVLAGIGASPEIAAADILAQAEHDSDAQVAVVCLEESFARALDAELARQLSSLNNPNRDTASSSLSHGWILAAKDEDEAILAVERFAPEHLAIFDSAPERWESRIRNAGAVFLGTQSAEVFGDYGLGPNHCLPTGGAARFASGLNVFNFMRPRTWLQLTQPGDICAEIAAFARIEGLEAHARSAEMRTLRS